MIDHGVVAGDRASHLTSLQYCMAVAALAPDMALDVQQSPPNLPPAISDFMEKIRIEADEALLADYPRRWRARVRVVAGSRGREWLTNHVPGDPAEPFDSVRVREKFLRFVTPAIGRDKAGQVLARSDDALASGQFKPLLAEIEDACSSASSDHHFDRNASV
jgi:2-methylcitrate dehydratase PrpD